MERTILAQVAGRETPRAARWQRRVAGIVSLVSVLACSSDVAAPPGTGIQGKVMAGPTCPAEQNPPLPQCADKPVVNATIVVRTMSGQSVTSFKSDANGEFKVGLPPGSYGLVPQAGT